MGEAEAIDLFLHAASVGLFQMEWNLVCASCGNTARSFRSLTKVDPHFVCETCQMDNHSTLDEYIQVAFTVSPRVRGIVYHDPESLSAEERLFNYQLSHDIRPGSGALTTLGPLRDSTHLLRYMDPGEDIATEFEFSGEAMAIRDPSHAASVMYVPQSSDRLDAVSKISIVLADGRFTDRERRLEPFEFVLPGVGTEMRLLFPGMATIPNGPLRVSVRNDMEERALVWVVEYPKIPTEDEPLQFEPILSAKQVLSTQTFRTLFRSETLAASESLEVKDLTFLFTDLRDSTAMYERIGDASAYNLVRLHFDALEVAIREHGGAIVKTIGDAIMATFIQPAAGVAAALEMSRRLEAFNRTGSTDLVLKMGVHRGHAIAVSSNDSVDYFGQTVTSRRASRRWPGQAICA